MSIAPGVDDARSSYRTARLDVMSGTGNSLRVAMWFQSCAQRAGVTTSLGPIEEPHPHRDRQAGPQHLVVLAFPTHGFTTPWHMLKFAARMPKGEGTHAVFIATRAGAAFGPLQPPGVSGSATFVPALLLALKGYRVRGALSVNMPSNWMSLHWGLHPRNVDRVKTRSRPKVERFADRVLQGSPAWWTLNNLYEALNGLSLLPVSLLYLLLGRIMLAKLFFANNSCNACGLCVQACPVGALEMRGDEVKRPFWGYNCESCMRCMGYCSRKSIEAGHSWLLLTTIVSLVPIGLWWWLWGDTTVTGVLAVDVLLLSIAYLLFSYFGMIGAYALFNRAMRNRTFNAVFTYSTFTHLYRRYHEPETRLKKLLPTGGLRARAPGAEELADSADDEQVVVRK